MISVTPFWQSHCTIHYQPWMKYIVDTSIWLDNIDDTAIWQPKLTILLGVSSFQLRQYYTSRYALLAQHRSLLNNHFSIDTSILQKIEVTPFWLNPDDTQVGCSLVIGLVHHQGRLFSRSRQRLATILGSREKASTGKLCSRYNKKTFTISTPFKRESLSKKLV